MAASTDTESGKAAVVKEIRRNYFMSGIGKMWTTPDGQNTVEKVKVMTATSAALGVAVGGYGVKIARCRFFYHGVAVFTRCFLSVTGAGAIYAFVTNMMGEKRNKSDLTNHIVGGLVAGVPFGGVARSYKYGFTFGSIIATFAVVAKLKVGYDIPLQGEERVTATWNYRYIPKRGRQGYTENYDEHRVA